MSLSSLLFLKKRFHIQPLFHRHRVDLPQEDHDLIIPEREDRRFMANPPMMME
ncbi:MAG: hypothetical protein GKS05_08475 [Nitrospirales bacterium]|nr:hypothetical protein [Nitrospirales bacterium]